MALESLGSFSLGGLAPLSSPMRGLGRPPSRRLTEEEETSILGRAANQGLSALSYLGETLDKSLGGRTSRMVQGWLQGMNTGQEALASFAHLIPFSDTLGLTDASGWLGGAIADYKDVPTGVELNQDLGIDTGYGWMNTGLGIAREALTDPSLFVKVGPLTKYARELEKVGDAKNIGKTFAEGAEPAGRIFGASPAARMEEARGMWHRLGEFDHTQDAGLRQATQQALDLKAKYGGEIRPILDGPKRAIDFRAPERQALGIGLPSFFGFGKKWTDANYIPVLNGATKLLGKWGPSLNSVSNLLYYSHPAQYSTAPIRALFDSRVRGVQDVAHQFRLDLQYARSVQSFAEARHTGVQLLLADSKMKKFYEEMAQNSGSPETYDNAMRVLLENGNDQMMAGAAAPTLQEVGTYLSQLHQGAPAQQLTEAAEMMHSLVERMLKVDDTAMAELTSLGADTHQLVEMFGRHFPRRPGNMELQQLDDMKIASAAHPFMIARDKALKNIQINIPGLPPGQYSQTRAVNHLAMDPEITAGKFLRLFMQDLRGNGRLGKRALENISGSDSMIHYLMTEEGLTRTAAGQALRDGLGEDIMRGYLESLGMAQPDAAAYANKLLTGTEEDLLEHAAEKLRTYYGLQDQYAAQTAAQAAAGTPPELIQSAEILAKKMHSLPPAVLEKGLFNRETIIDQLEYIEHTARVKAGLEAIHAVLEDPNVLKDISELPGAPTLAEAWRSAGLKEPGLATLLSKHGHTDPAQVSQWANNLAVPDMVAKSIKKIREAHFNPESTNMLAKGVNWWTNAFRGFVTLPWPAFHMRNLISGQWNNFMAGQWSLSSMMKAGKMFFKGEVGDEKLLAEIIAHRVLGYGNAHEIATQLANRATFDSPSGKAVLNAFAEPLTAEGLSGKMKSLAPLPLGKNGEQTFFLNKAGTKVHEGVEFVNRVAAYMELRKQGFTPAVAAWRVKMTQYDNNELTQFERNTMRHLFTFYSYSRKNLPHQLAQIVAEPGGRTALNVRAINTAREEGSYKGYTPKMLGRGIAIPVQRGEDSVTFLRESGLLPVTEALGRINMSGNLPDALGNLEEAAGMMNPVYKTVAQEAFGRQFWSHRDADRLYQYPLDPEGISGQYAPIGNRILTEMLPTGRLFSTIRQFQDDRTNKLQKLANFTVGSAGFTTINDERRLLELRDILQSDVSGQPGISKLTKPYVYNPRIVSPENDKKMRAISRITKQTEDLAKKRRAAAQEK